ncbi:carbohydrate binding [Branchiostoma belcheri]|nr:carbohydrate binding [Branchiostoma belcheri]
MSGERQQPGFELPTSSSRGRIANHWTTHATDQDLHKITYPNFPLYHTAYETFHLQKTYIDPEFKFHRLMSQLWGELALSLAESWTLPISASEYAGTVQGMYDWLVDEYRTKFEESAISLGKLGFGRWVASVSLASHIWEPVETTEDDTQAKIKGAHPSSFGVSIRSCTPSNLATVSAVKKEKENNCIWDERISLQLQDQLNALQSAVANFTQAAVMFEDELSSLENNTDPLVARMYNDQLMQMEQAFINPQGILYQKFSRHTILSSGLWNTETFPALGDAVRRMGSDWTDPGKKDKLKELKQELSIITFFIQSAANSLAKPATPNGDLTEEFGGESWLPQTRQVGCSSGYQMHNGICYKAFNTPKNFHDASSACATDGGTLAMPKDASTNDFLLSLKNAVDESGFFWFGLVDHHQEGGWEWVDGTPIGSFNAWEPGEPNNAGDEDCAEYFPTAWNDAQCSEADRKFICQKIPTGCPGGYVYHQPSRLCYKAFNEKTTYSGAVAKCSADGGTLAIPRSPIINKFLIYLKNAVDTTAWFRFGLTDHHHQEGDWIWDDYVALGNFSSWGPEDNCAEYFPGSHSTKDTWNDGPCASADRKFICQVYPLGCPPGYQQHGHNCYKANNDKKSYDNAAATCRADGGSLAMPRDLQTHEFLVTLKNQVDRSAWFWLGFNDQSQEGEWHYVDGTRLGSFHPWYPNEPNNHGGNEDCGVMFQDDQNNEWNDQGCSSELKFICQISLQGHLVRLTFLDFDLENSEFDLEFDHVTVVDGSIDKQLGKFSGTNLPPAVTSSGRTMEVIFTTDQSVTERGFKAQYRVTAWKSDTYMTFCCSSSTDCDDVISKQLLGGTVLTFPDRPGTARKRYNPPPNICLSFKI